MDFQCQKCLYIIGIRLFSLFTIEFPKIANETSSPGEKVKVKPGDLSNPFVYSILSLISPSPSSPILHSSPYPFFL